MPKNTQSIDDKILKSIRATNSALAFQVKHFLQFGTNEAIRKALQRLVQAGKLRRIRQGLYDLPQEHPIIGQTAPDPMGVIKALMDGSNAQWQVSGAYAANLLGLSEQVPTKIVILTDGISRLVELDALTISFRRASPRNLLGAGKLAGTVIQALRYLRKDGVTQKHIHHLNKQLDAKTKKELKTLCAKLPVWMQGIVQEIAE